MSALSTQLIEAVAAQLPSVVPNVPVFVRRDTEKNPIFWQDMPLSQGPVLAVSANANQTRKNATALKVFCTYEIVVHYLTKELPGQRTELPDARTQQEAIRKAFDMAGWDEVVPGVTRCEPSVGKPYDTPFEDKTVCDSTVKLAFATFESRN